MSSAATRSSSMGSSDIEFALDLEDIAVRAAKVDCVGVLACGHTRFSYHRLPEPPLRLTVRKLDDSYFGTKSRPLPFNSPRTMWVVWFCPRLIPAAAWGSQVCDAACVASG